MYIYFEKGQFKMLVTFSAIFVEDTKMILGYNFGAPLITSKLPAVISYPKYI